MRALQDEDARRLLEALSPEEAEQLVGLRPTRGLEWPAIAEATGVPEATLRQRWSRLRRRLETLLDPGG